LIIRYIVVKDKPVVEIIALRYAIRFNQAPIARCKAD
jgi:hypothetical protein